MSEAPPLFLRTIDQHNRHCWIAAVGSLFSAWFAWLIFGGIYIALALLFETVRSGNAEIAAWPPWLIPLGLSIAGFLFVWASIDQFFRKYRPVTDRQIIGWHLGPDLVLLPARLTLAIWNHIGARITLSPSAREQAWQLLKIIEAQKRLPLSEINMQIADVPVQDLLIALQVTSWIDLHRGQDDWFYRVRGDAEQSLRELTDGPPEETV